MADLGDHREAAVDRDAGDLVVEHLLQRGRGGGAVAAGDSIGQRA
jgi:hypothetical protein